MATPFPQACRAYILSQFGSLLQHPKALEMIPLCQHFPDVAEALGKRLEAGPISRSEIERIAAENNTTAKQIELLLTSLTAAEIKPSRARLVDFVLRDTEGKVVTDSVDLGALIRANDRAAMEKIFVSWEKAPCTAN